MFSIFLVFLLFLGLVGSDSLSLNFFHPIFFGLLQGVFIVLSSLHGFYFLEVRNLHHDSFMIYCCEVAFSLRPGLLDKQSNLEVIHIWLKGTFSWNIVHIILGSFYVILWARLRKFRLSQRFSCVRRSAIYFHTQQTVIRRLFHYRGLAFLGFRQILSFLNDNFSESSLKMSINDRILMFRFSSYFRRNISLKRRVCSLTFLQPLHLLIFGFLLLLEHFLLLNNLFLLNLIIIEDLVDCFEGLNFKLEVLI